MDGDVSPASAALFEHVYIVGTGCFLPGAPVDNDCIDRFIAPLDRKSDRIKRRVLRDNGIRTRHYAIDEAGQTQFSSWQLAKHAIADALAASPLTADRISLLCSGSSGGDSGMPGFANMVQGALGLPPLEASSHQGICAAGMQALKYAASSIELGAHNDAIVVTAELPSRLFKRSRFEPQGYRTDFDAQFLRWMLSDGAGAWVASRTVPRGFKALKVEWMHCRAFSGDSYVSS